MRSFITAVALAAALGLGACASTMPASVKTGQTSLGSVLTDEKGMTLYTFDRDQGVKSVCNGPCATNWPPLMATASDTQQGDWSVITRDDGSKQWAYKSKPLYRWAKDTKPGDATGDGFLNGAWHAARP